MSPTYQQLLTLLSRYLSHVNAQLTLDRALKRLDVTPKSLGDEHVRTILPHLERSLGLFVEQSRLPSLLTDLKQRYAGASAVETVVVPVDGEADVAEARIQARQLCEHVGAPSLIRQKVVTVVSELARNIALYAPPGRVEVVPFTDPPKRIVVRAIDSGPGIKNLEEIMAGHYKSRTGLGKGLRGCKRLVNRFEIDSGERGTRIEAEVSL